MSDSMVTAVDVQAVVATYAPDDSVVANVLAVLEQVGRVIVVDDGSGPQADEVLGSVRRIDPSTVEVLRLRTNSGIAAALNAGVDAALAAGAVFVLTLDQDSRVAPDYVATALAAARRLRRGGHPFAAIAAGAQSGRPVRPVLYPDRGDSLTPTIDAIQSGMLIPAATFRSVGLFDESLFIDCVDTDFVARAAMQGMPTYLARGCALDHPLGRVIETPGVRITRSGRRAFSFHPAWRRYYISRNRTIMLGRYGIRRPRWAIESLAGESVQLLRSVAFGPDKGRQVAAVLVGVADALTRRRGRLLGMRASLVGAAR